MQSRCGRDLLLRGSQHCDFHSAARTEDCCDGKLPSGVTLAVYVLRVVCARHWLRVRGQRCTASLSFVVILRSGESQPSGSGLQVFSARGSRKLGLQCRSSARIERSCSARTGHVVWAPSFRRDVLSPAPPRQRSRPRLQYRPLQARWAGQAVAPRPVALARISSLEDPGLREDWGFFACSSVRSPHALGRGDCGQQERAKRLVATAHGVVGPPARSRAQPPKSPRSRGIGARVQGRLRAGVSAVQQWGRDKICCSFLGGPGHGLALIGSRHAERFLAVLRQGSK